MIILFTLLSQTLARSLPFSYHTTEQLNTELDGLKSRCNFISLGTASEEPLIKEVYINRDQQKKYKGYILFGEHPRELISPESGLHFLNDLCNNEDAKNSEILENYELRMILNANPMSRSKVEQGEFCLRENENGVDLNRNYDAHWQKIKDDERQITSGDHPFSEPETQAIRDSLRQYKPDIFLSVHSGTLGMYTPHAYSMEDAEFNEDKMVDVLQDLSHKYCPSCDVGAAGKEVGYLSPGSCVDYAYDELKIRYSFAFEIYHGAIDLRQEIQSKAQSFLQMNHKKARKDRVLKESCFLELGSHSTMDNDSCFEYFNPEAKDYDWYVDNWTQAYKEMLVKMIAEEKSQ